MVAIEWAGADKLNSKHTLMALCPSLQASMQGTLQAPSNAPHECLGCLS